MQDERLPEWDTVADGVLDQPDIGARPQSASAHALFLRRHLGPTGTSQPASSTRRDTQSTLLDGNEAVVVADLLDELAIAHQGDALGLLAREMSILLWSRLDPSVTAVGLANSESRGRSSRSAGIWSNQSSTW